MLTIEIPGIDIFDERIGKFQTTKPCKVQLEHSLLSLAKWEAEWNEPFLSKKEISREKFRDYVRCMSIGQHDPQIFLGLTNENYSDIRAYIDKPMTATTFSKNNQRTNKEIVTAEILYYRMISNHIPMECQKWHLNRLLTLIRVCDEKSAPPKKMGKRQTAERNAQLNAMRRKQFNSKG